MLPHWFRSRPDNQASLDEGLCNPLLVGLRIVEGDVEPVLRRRFNADHSVHAPEDRPYPRVGASGVATRNIELIRLFRRGKWRGQDQKQQHRTTQAEDHFPHHSVFLFIMGSPFSPVGSQRPAPAPS